MSEVFRVLRPGPFTTVQDSGRVGYQRYGVPVSGALDRFAYLTSNWLVGNPEGRAVLEITLMRLELEVLSKADVAVCGADIPFTVNDERGSPWTSFRVRAGDVVSFRQAARGLRAYMAVTGGIEVPEVLGSRSTYVAAGLGGYYGRALLPGDVLSRGEGAPVREHRRLTEDLRPSWSREVTLRAVPGPQTDFFDEALDSFFQFRFTVSPKADRMGYRLEGPAIALRASAPRSIISEPCVPGGVQIPSDGKPIVLLVEQTVGGYAKIATVVSSDLDRLAQARPGDFIRFARTDLKGAHRLHREYRDKLVEVKRSLVAVQ